MKISRLAILAAAAIALPLAASAEIYLKLGDIKGEAQDGKHTEWIELLSVSEDMGRAIDMTDTSGRSVSRLELTPLSFARMVDKASPALRKALTTGQVFKEAEIHITRAGSSDSVYQIKLTNAHLAGLSAQYTGDSMEESGALAYSAIEWKAISVNPRTGKTEEGAAVRYDIQTGQTR